MKAEINEVENNTKQRKINKTKHLVLEKESAKLASLQPGESRKKKKMQKVKMSEIKEAIS